jgi:hypothetical protein
VVVGDGKGSTGAAIEQLAPEFLLHHDPSTGAEDPVQRDGSSHLGETVFREDDGLYALLTVEREQPTHDGVDGAIVFGHTGAVRTEALQVVVDVRQVDE